MARKRHTPEQIIRKPVEDVQEVAHTDDPTAFQIEGLEESNLAGIVLDVGIGGGYCMMVSLHDVLLLLAVASA